MKRGRGRLLEMDFAAGLTNAHPPADPRRAKLVQNYVKAAEANCQQLEKANAWRARSLGFDAWVSVSRSGRNAPVHHYFVADYVFVFMCHDRSLAYDARLVAAKLRRSPRLREALLMVWESVKHAPATPHTVNAVEVWLCAVAVDEHRKRKPPAELVLGGGAG